MFQTKVVEKIETYILYIYIYIYPPPSENFAVNVVMWKNIVEQGRPPMTIWRMRIAYWNT